MVNGKKNCEKYFIIILKIKIFIFTVFNPKPTLNVAERREIEFFWIVVFRPVVPGCSKCRGKGFS